LETKESFLALQSPGNTIMWLREPNPGKALRHDSATVPKYELGVPKVSHAYGTQRTPLQWYGRAQTVQPPKSYSLGVGLATPLRPSSAFCFNTKLLFLRDARGRRPMGPTSCRSMVSHRCTGPSDWCVKPSRSKRRIGWYESTSMCHLISSRVVLMNAILYRTGACVRASSEGSSDFP